MTARIGYNHPSDLNKSSLFPVVRSLVFKPLSVSLDTADFLPVVIRHRVSKRIGGGVNAEAFYSVVELFLFLFY